MSIAALVPPRPRWRPSRTDLVLAAAFAVHSVLATLAWTPASRPLAVVGGLALGIAQVVPLLVRRSFPVIVLAVITATVPLQFGLALHSGGWVWLVAVYTVCVYRRPPVALGALGVVLPCGLAGMVGAFAPIHSDGLRGAAFEAGDALQGSLVYLVVAAGLGLAVRADGRRADRRRDAVERARITAELERERSRIQADLVAALGRDLRRVVELATTVSGLTRPDPRCDLVLVGLREQARRALDATRRLLTTLRSTVTAEPETGSAPERTPLWHRPTRSGIAFACVLVVLGLTVPTLLGDHPSVAGIVGPTAADPAPTAVLVAALVAQAVPFVWWRSAPITALLAGGVLTAVATACHATWGVVDWASLLLLYSAAATARRWLSLLAAAVYACLPLLVGLRYGTDPGPPDAGTLLTVVVGVPALWVLGVVHHRAGRDRDTGRAIRTALAVRDTLTAERRRVARELHDALGHHLSAITIHARVAATARTSRPDTYAAAIRDVGDCARAIADSLPAVTDMPDMSAPETLLTEATVRRLTAALAADGTPVAITVHGRPPGTSADEVDLFALRILQEAITNVGRHARRTHTTVVVTHDPTRLELEVRNGPLDGIGPTTDVSDGHGLVNMRERAELLGGRLTAGPQPDRTWLVHARLPRPCRTVAEVSAGPFDA